MRAIMPVFIFVGVLTFASFGAEAQQLPHAAPVPQQILISKSAFVSNAGVDNVLLSYVKRFTGSPAGLYNKFYAAMQTWGKYELVPTVSDADLIFEVRLVPYREGDAASDPQFQVNILDPKTHVILWNFSESIPAGSGRQETRQKKFDQAFDELFDDIKSLATQSVSSSGR